MPDSALHRLSAGCRSSLPNCRAEVGWISSWSARLGDMNIATESDAGSEVTTTLFGPLATRPRLPGFSTRCMI